MTDGQGFSCRSARIASFACRQFSPLAVLPLARWLYRQLEAEYDHLTSDETIEEGIIVNEYTFTEGGRAVWLASRLFVRVVQPANFHRTFVLWATHPNPERNGGKIQQSARVRIIHAGSLLMQPGDHLACGILIAALVFGDFHRVACIGLSVFGIRASMPTDYLAIDLMNPTKGPKLCWSTALRAAM